MALVLQIYPDVKGSTNVRKRIKHKLLEWKEDKHRVLTASAILCSEATMKRKRGSTKPAKRANVFNSLVCSVKIRSYIRHAYERCKGDMLLPDDVDEKTGELFSNVLLSNQPNGRYLEMKSIPYCDSCPDLINTNSSKENVETVAKFMSGSSSPT